MTYRPDLFYHKGNRHTASIYGKHIGGGSTILVFETRQSNSALSSEKMRITDSGSVKINNHLSVGANLTVIGNSLISGITVLTGAARLASTLSVAGTSLIDNVHIGKHATESGNSAIGFFSHSNASSSGQYALAQNSSGLTTLNSASGQPLQFDIANSEKMRIHTNGFVGIANTTPSTYLVVGEDGGGHSGVTPGIHMKSTSSERKHYVVGQATDRNAFLTWHYNATENSAYAHLGTYAGSNSLALQADGGNVGIGSTTPGARLDVVGTTKISQTLSVGGHANLASTTHLVGAVKASSTLSVGGNFDIHPAGGYASHFGLNNSIYLRPKASGGSVFINESAQGVGVQMSGAVVVKQTLSVGSDLTVNGNLVVVGNSTKVNIHSETVQVGDNMIQLNANTTSSTGYVPDVDFGFFGQTTIGGSVQYAGLAYDKSANAIITFRSSSAPGQTISGLGMNFLVNGSVGIGTNNTRSEFHLHKSVGGSAESLNRDKNIFTVSQLDNQGNTAKDLVSIGAADNYHSGVITIHRNSDIGTYTPEIFLDAGGDNPSYFGPNCGNLGIGSTTPGAKLDVVGTTKISQTLSVGGSARLSEVNFGATIGNKITLYDSSGNDYSFGITSGSLNYTVNSTGDAHRFYQTGNGGSYGTELFRIGATTIASASSKVSSLVDHICHGTLSVAGASTLKSTLSVGDIVVLGNGNAAKLRFTNTGSNYGYNYFDFYDSSTRRWYVGQNNDGNFMISNDNQSSARFFAIDKSSGNILLPETLSVGGATRITQTLSIGGALKASGLSYPTSDGTNGQVLQTNGSGTLSWTDNSGGGGSSVWSSGSGLIYYNSGNVGINSSSPGAKLDVVGTTKLSQTLSVGGNLTILGTSAINLHPTDNNSLPPTDVFNFKNTNGFGIYATSVSITSRGNTLDYKARDYNSGGSIQDLNLLTLHPNGNVGIGSTSPSEKLVVSNGDILLTGDWNSGDYFRIKGINNAKKIEFNYDNGTIIADNNNVIFETNFDNGSSHIERMRINSSGNIGIGTNNPGSTLDVNGTTKLRQTLSVGGHANITSSVYIRGTDVSSDNPKSGITLQGDGSLSGSYSTMMIFDSTSSGKYFMGATSQNWTAGSNKFLFGANGPASSNTIMAMDGANSRIGIGTYTPGSTLDVNGATRLRSTLSVGGATTLTGTLSVGGLARLSEVNFGATTSNKITLYDASGNDYAFGISGNSLNYTVSSTSDAHRFYQTGSGGSPGTELFRIGATTLASASSKVSSLVDHICHGTLSVAGHANLASTTHLVGAVKASSTVDIAGLLIQHHHLYF